MALDPVDVLRHLNALGYDNVEPHLLQQFMKGNVKREYFFKLYYVVTDGLLDLK